MTSGTQISPATRFLTLDKPLALECGERLTGVQVAYRSWGRLASDGANAVLVCHSLTASADADAWWPALIGAGRVLDPERDFIVCANVLGSCYGTTGPASPRPGHARPWGPDFPPITIRDIVRAQTLLLDGLGVRHLALVIGGSLGGMQVLEWAASFPERVGAIVPIAASGRHSPWSIAFSETQRAAIRADARFCAGRYGEEAPAAGLAAARMIAMCSYRSPASFAGRFGRATDLAGEFAVARYLHHHGASLVARFDANSYITLTLAMDTHDLARGRGEYAAILRAMGVPALVVSIDSDLLYPPEEQRELAEGMPSAELATLSSPHGHDAFLIEGEQVGRLVAGFRSRLATAPHATAHTPRRVVASQPPLEATYLPRVVLKFGGSSVADEGRLRQMAAIVTARAASARVVVVVSALGGVTDELLAMAAAAAAGSRSWEAALLRLTRRHLGCLRELGGGDGPAHALRVILDELQHALAALAESGGCPARARDAVLAAGERLAVHLAATALRQAGIDAAPCDARELIVTDSCFGEAVPDPERTALLVRDRLGTMPAGVVPVVTGFIAADADGRTTTLGRGGSDYTASLLGAALDAERVEIWTDVNGVLAAPPQVVPQAATLRFLTYGEAAALARFGAKVLHPKTMLPLAERGIGIVVANTFAPDAAQTVIARHTGLPDARPRGVTALEGVALITVEAGTAHDSAKALAELRRRLPDGALLPCASADAGRSALAVLAVPTPVLRRVITETTSQIEESDTAATLRLHEGLGIVALIGEGIAENAVAIAHARSALAAARIGVLALARTGSPAAAALVLRRGHLPEALWTLHQALIASGRGDAGTTANVAAGR